MTVEVLARVRLPAITGLPRDDVQNDLVYQFATGPTNTDLDNLGTAIAQFFNIVGTGHHTIAEYLARDRDYTANHTKVDFYGIPATPGPLLSPIYSFSWTLGDPGATPRSLPDNLAAALSFHGDTFGIPERAGATRPAARRRGRIFIGPLNSLTLEEAAGTVAAQTVASDFLDDLARAAQNYLLTAAFAHGWTWVVWSRTSWAFYPVIGGYSDDRFDTQRRRLEKSTGRIAWGL